MESVCIFIRHGEEFRFGMTKQSHYKISSPKSGFAMTTLIDFHFRDISFYY